jgi:flagellar biosynthetic protein FlhB
VPFTGEWPFAAALLAMLVALGTWGVTLFAVWKDLAHDAFSLELSLTQSIARLRELGALLAVLLAMPLLAAFALVVLQRAPSLRMFNSDADPRAPRRRPAPYGRVQQATVTVLKWLVMALVLGSLLSDSLPGLIAAYERSADALWTLSLRVLRGLLLRAFWALLLLGAFDLLAQQWVRMRRLRMTRREVLDEQRELSGDPTVMAERRARALSEPAQLLTPQLYAAKLAQLSAASLVLTGEGRALALQYAPERMLAPVLWLKAEGSQAVELLARAYAVGVPLASDGLLADDLYRLELMQPIPAAFHARVAQLMAGSQRVKS